MQLDAKQTSALHNHPNLHSALNNSNDGRTQRCQSRGWLGLCAADGSSHRSLRARPKRCLSEHLWISNPPWPTSGTDLWRNAPTHSSGLDENESKCRRDNNSPECSTVFRTSYSTTYQTVCQCAKHCTKQVLVYYGSKFPFVERWENQIRIRSDVEISNNSLA
jgi:hypothetical protein